jgi:hypothetical protein
MGDCQGGDPARQPGFDQGIGVRAKFQDTNFLLHRYSGGGLRRGLRRTAIPARNPLPYPPQEYRGRRKCPKKQAEIMPPENLRTPGNRAIAVTLYPPHPVVLLVSAGWVRAVRILPRKSGCPDPAIERRRGVENSVEPQMHADERRLELKLPSHFLGEYPAPRFGRYWLLICVAIPSIVSAATRVITKIETKG